MAARERRDPAGALTRRELLAAAGAGAALALAGCGDGGGPLAGASRRPMLKGISLIGDVNVYGDALGVRPYLLGGPHPVDLVGLWTVWTALQPLAPAPFTRAQAFRDLSDPAGPAAAFLASLDAQIAQANADGRKVLLTVYQAFPPWTAPAGDEPGRTGLPPDARVPADLTPDGSWAWFVGYLCARYADTNGERGPGPGRAGARAGNPLGARIDWLAPMNEPNLTWWPQQAPRFPDGTIASAVAQMARTAAAVAAAQDGTPGLLIPNTADVVSPASPHGTPWDAFTAELLAQLRGWRPAVPVAWAHHHYADVKRGPQATGRWRVEDVLELQHANGWPQPAVWLTEGGYQFAVRRDGPDPARYVVDPARTADPTQPNAYAEQVAKLRANWAAMARLPEVRLWTQYLLNDTDVRFQSSLRGPVRAAANGAPVPNDPPYPAYALWSSLGA
jgi:hypothetical protein